MSKRPNYSDPWEAMRVAQFMRNAKVGRWKLERFTLTPRDAEVEALKAIFGGPPKSAERASRELERAVPPGRYIALKRRMTEAEAYHHIDLPDEDIARYIEAGAIDDLYVPVMSDTPAELREHAHPIEHARGRVLINGLGLGCLVSGLLCLPKIEHIDVVEIDPDVRKLTGAYYADDPRVTIHRGDAAKPDATFPSNARWDYAWHDIWSTIAPRNLDDETAEFGISYPFIFSLYEDRADTQCAWAYDEALWMREVEARDAKRHREFEDRLWAEPDFEARVEMAVDLAIRENMQAGSRTLIDADSPIPPSVRKFFDDQGLTDTIRTNLRGMTRESVEAWRRERGRDRPPPLGNPNAYIKEDAA